MGIIDDSRFLIADKVLAGSRELPQRALVVAFATSSTVKLSRIASYLGWGIKL